MNFITNSAEPDFGLNGLRDYLEKALGPDDGNFELTRIGGGQSNPSFFLQHGKSSLVLRKQPGGPIQKGAHAIDREYRVLNALQSTDVPVPEPVLYCEDTDIIGEPFYLMERIEGRVLSNASLAEVSPEERRPIWMAVAETMAKMHALDPDEIGLGDYGRLGSYFERQLNRWDKQYREAELKPIPAIERISEWLAENRPNDDGVVSLCHGDFRLGNLMFHPTKPRVVAVLDWELSTLGHPLADLGFCCMPWHTSPEEYGGLLGVDLKAMHLPAETEFTSRYMEALPSSPPLLPFHTAFALYRFAVIFVGIAERVRLGNASDPEAARLTPLSEKFAQRALEIARGDTHRILA